MTGTTAFSSGVVFDGFAEALVGVDGKWRGITVNAMPKETQVIDFNPPEQRRTSLPGAGVEAYATDARTFQAELEQRAVVDHDDDADSDVDESDGDSVEANDDA